MLALIPQLNWVDWLVLVVVALGTVGGLRRGLLVGAVDLLGLLASLFGSIVAYPAVSGWLRSVTDLPASIAAVGSLVGVALLVQAVYWWLVTPAVRGGHALLQRIRPVAVLDTALGAGPGAVRGLVLAGLLLLPFGLLPVVPAVSAGIERSVIGSRLVSSAIAVTPDIESLLGRDLADALTFVAPPQTDAGRDLELGRLGALTPDPDAEQRMLDLVNQERQLAGLRPLEFDPALREVARSHSRDMFENSYFSHESPTTGSPADRARRAGISPRLLGENLAYAPNVRIAHEGLMNSPGHRANILRGEYGRVGIGVIKSEFRGSMYTQNFRD